MIRAYDRLIRQLIEQAGFTQSEAQAILSSQFGFTESLRLEFDDLFSAGIQPGIRGSTVAAVAAQVQTIFIANALLVAAARSPLLWIESALITNDGAAANTFTLRTNVQSGGTIDAFFRDERWNSGDNSKRMASVIVGNRSDAVSPGFPMGVLASLAVGETSPVLPIDIIVIPNSGISIGGTVVNSGFSVLWKFRLIDIEQGRRVQ